MKNSYFPVSKITFEGPASRNPLAFKHYNAEEIVEGKTMRDHLRFAVVYWHTFRGTGSDPLAWAPCNGRGMIFQLRGQRAEARACGL